MSLTFYNDESSGAVHIGPTPTKQLSSTIVVDNIAYKIHTVVVGEFEVFSFESFAKSMVAANQITAWQNTEQGKFVAQYALESPTIHHMKDYSTQTVKLRITAKLKDCDYVIWILKFE